MTNGAGKSGTAARQLAVEAMRRIEEEGAYANLVLPGLLADSHLETRDRGFVTELVYGVTRMQRACDHLADRYVTRPPDPVARRWLRLGTYQLVFLHTPAHAAVDATVGAAPQKLRGFLNAVLRKVAKAEPTWPTDAITLSYPDWIFERLVADLGHDDALGAMQVMNEAPPVTTREDGYVQDQASQWVAELVEPSPGELVLDAAAAPGGKATAMASTGARVVAADVRPGRAALLAGNVARLAKSVRETALSDVSRTNLEEVGAVAAVAAVGAVDVVCADGTAPPFRPGSFDRVLVDAPCSGLGALRRRPDARWRVQQTSVDELAALQQRLVDALVPLVRPGGVFVYSVCTLTEAEGPAIDRYLAEHHPELVPLDAPAEPWTAIGRGARLLPQAAGTDGMYLLRLRVPVPDADG